MNTSNKLDYEKSTVFFRDQYIPFAQANLSIASSPVLYGLSIYTVFSVCWNERQQALIIFRLKDHYRRLVKSANIMDFDSFSNEWTFEKFKTTMLSLLQQNNIREDVLVRVTVFIDELIAGTKIHGLQNSLSAYVYPMGEILSKSGVSLCVSSWVRNPDNSIPSRAKINGSYINASLMKNEALLNGYDDAIAVDTHGHVAESTVANIFIVRDNQLITPSQDTDILEGITRDTIITLAQDQGMGIIERSIDRSELYICDEVFLCGSSANITPVLSVDKRKIGSGEVGAVTKHLMEAYYNLKLGNSDSYKSWYTEI